MTIEGLAEHELVRDFLYRRMRGLRDAGRPGGGAATAAAPAVPHATSAAAAGESVAVEALLREIAAEVRATREALERRAG